MKTHSPIQRIIAKAIVIVFAGSATVLGTEILSNGSFDSANSWTVFPEQSETWTCIAGGEASLHPPTAYTGTLLMQTLSVENVRGRRLRFAGVMSKLSAPPAATIAFVLEYADMSNASQKVTLLQPNNDSIGMETVLSAEIILPLGAKTITGFSVEKTNYGLFSLQSVSLDLLAPPIAITSPANGTTFDMSDTVTMAITLDDSITGPRSVRILNNLVQLGGASPTSFIDAWKMANGSMINFHDVTSFNYVHEDEYFFFEGAFTNNRFAGNFSAHSIAGMASGAGVLDFAFDANGLLTVTTSGDAPLGVRNLTGGKSTLCRTYRFLWQKPPAGVQLLTAVVTHTDTTTGKTYTLASLPVTVTVQSSAAPEIDVREPLDNKLTDGSCVRNFGRSYIGADGMQRTFTIKNSGTATLSGLAITKNGVHAADFVVGGLAQTSLAPGASATFKVLFRPKGGGDRFAALHIASNDADENPFDIALTGEGNFPPEIAVEQPVRTMLKDAANTTQFGTVLIGGERSRTYTIRNKGKGRLTGIMVMINGVHAKDFHVTQPSRTSLAPDTAITFKVTFKPRYRGNRVAAIHIKSNDADESPFDIKLAGVGARP